MILKGFEGLKGRKTRTTDMKLIVSLFHILYLLTCYLLTDFLDFSKTFLLIQHYKVNIFLNFLINYFIAEKGFEKMLSLFIYFAYTYILQETLFEFYPNP